MVSNSERFFPPENGFHHSPTSLSSENERSLHRLNRAISLSQGEFSLILCVCNRPALRRKVTKQLQNISPLKVSELTLHPSVNTLFSTVQTALQNQSPDALVILGLESVVNLDDLLSSTNLVRELFAQKFAFPLVLWVNDDTLIKLTRIYTDFRSWGGSSIRFEVSCSQDAPQNHYWPLQYQIVTG
ncbi:MAG: hypothetical protein WA865_02505 [Spirulinaceae cyanobacterium]